MFRDTGSLRTYSARISWTNAGTLENSTAGHWQDWHGVDRVSLFHSFMCAYQSSEICFPSGGGMVDQVNAVDGGCDRCASLSAPQAHWAFPVARQTIPPRGSSDVCVSNNH